MLIFLDKTFRVRLDKNGREIPFGALCGVGIPIESYSKIANAVFKLKLETMGKEYAEDKEIKGKKLLNNRTFRLMEANPEEPQKNIQFVSDLIDVLRRNKLPVFGCVCYDQQHRDFTCENDALLDSTFKSLCERINMYMKREHQDKKAILVFDNRDSGTDERNARAVTNFLVRSGNGRTMRSSILEVPMFAISQANNVGLQLADLVTTIIGIYATGESGVSDLYNQLHRQFYSWKDNYGRAMSTLRWIDPQRLCPRRQ